MGLTVSIPTVAVDRVSGGGVVVPAVPVVSASTKLSLDSMFSTPVADDVKEVTHSREVEDLHEDMAHLRDAGVLYHSLDGHQGREFLLLNFHGDAIMRSTLTQRLLESYNEHHDPLALPHIRSASENQATLAKLFTEIDLANMVMNPPSISMGWKAMAATILAVMGELEVQLKGEASTSPHREVIARVMEGIVKAALHRGTFLKMDHHSTNKGFMPQQQQQPRRHLVC